MNISRACFCRLVIGPLAAALSVVQSSVALSGELSTTPSAATLPKMINIRWHRGPDLPQGFQDSECGIVDGTLITTAGFCQGLAMPIPGKESKYPRGFLKKTWGLTLTDRDAGWQRLPDLPGDARQELFGVSVGDKLYVWGGFSYEAPYTYKDGYCLSRQNSQWRWEKMPDLPFALCSSGIAAIGGKIFVMGGMRYFADNGGGYHCNTPDQGAPIGSQLMVFDTVRPGDGWKILPHCPGTPRAVHAMAAVDGKLYIIGGANGTDNASKNLCTVVDNWRFDPSIQKWDRLADTPIASGNFPAGNIVFKDRYVLLIGGAQYGRVMGPDGQPHPIYGNTYKHYPNKWYNSDIFVYDTHTDTFGSATPMPLNNNLPAVVLKSNQLHLIGGETHGCAIDGELYGQHPDLYLIGDLKAASD